MKNQYWGTEIERVTQNFGICVPVIKPGQSDIAFRFHLQCKLYLLGIMCKDPGNIAFGNRRQEGFQAGKSIQYWCYDAYTLKGSARITCQKSGQWSAPKPVCSRTYSCF